MGRAICRLSRFLLLCHHQRLPGESARKRISAGRAQAEAACQDSRGPPGLVTCFLGVAASQSALCGVYQTPAAFTMHARTVHATHERLCARTAEDCTVVHCVCTRIKQKNFMVELGCFSMFRSPSFVMLLLWQSNSISVSHLQKRMCPEKLFFLVFQLCVV